MENASDQARTVPAPKPHQDKRVSRAQSAVRPAKKSLYAALDLGTNNCRLLIVEPHGRSFRVKDSFSRIVRLGEGLEANGALGEEAMERTIAALKICASKIRRLRVPRVRCVATEACRFAENGADFIKRVQKETGLRLEIIEGGSEAELAALGCENLFAKNAQSVLVFDIGGGSTELTLLKREGDARFQIADVASFPLGVVRLAERHAGPGEHEHGYDTIKQECLDILREFAAKQDRQNAPMQLVGTSGTVTTLAAVHLGLEKYDRSQVDGCVMQMTDMMRVVSNLRGKGRSELAQNQCIGVQRADLVLAGCAVLEAIYEIWPTDSVSVADRGLREGILLRMIRRDHRRNRRRYRGHRNKTDTA
jgi:exopolyphosphatase/guanosine-5'-triphosphate,3'-diphosphate pyrophosphatase